MYFVTKPRECDVFVFTPEDAELAELFAEYILEGDSEYDNAQIMIVDAQRLKDLIK